MLNIDPKVMFYLGLVLCIAQIIGNGGETFLAGAIPAVAVPFVVKWCLIVSAVGTAIMTYAAGGNMTQSGRIQNVKSVPFPVRAESFANNANVQSVVLKSQATADSITSDKVVGPNAA